MRMVTLAMAVMAAAGCGSGVKLEPPPVYANGVRISFEEKVNLAGPASALWFHGEATIYVNPDVFYDLEPEMQWWIIGHELGHLESPEASETGADCYGVRWMDSLGALTDRTVATITENVSEYHPSENHPEGALRTLNIFACVSGLDLLWSD